MGTIWRQSRLKEYDNHLKNGCFAIILDSSDSHLQCIRTRGRYGPTEICSQFLKQTIIAADTCLADEVGTYRKIDQFQVELSIQIASKTSIVATSSADTAWCSSSSAENRCARNWHTGDITAVRGSYSHSKKVTGEAGRMYYGNAWPLPWSFWPSLNAMPHNTLPQCKNSVETRTAHSSTIHLPEHNCRRGSRSSCWRHQATPAWARQTAQNKPENEMEAIPELHS